MRKPEKRPNYPKWSHPEQEKLEHCENMGYNQACDEWEEWLPSEEEIGEVIDTEFRIMGGTFAITRERRRKLAKAISKRLGR